MTHDEKAQLVMRLRNKTAAVRLTNTELEAVLLEIEACGYPLAKTGGAQSDSQAS